MPVASTNGTNFADVDAYRQAKRAAKESPDAFTRADFIKGSVLSALDLDEDTIAKVESAKSEASKVPTMPSDPREAELLAMAQQAEAERAKVRAERSGSARSVPIAEDKPELPKKPLPMPKAQSLSRDISAHASVEHDTATPPFFPKEPGPKMLDAFKTAVGQVRPKPLESEQQGSEEAHEQRPRFTPVVLPSVVLPTPGKPLANLPRVPVPIDSEIAAMATIADALRKLSPATRGRVMTWLTDRYRLHADQPK